MDALVTFLFVAAPVVTSAIAVGHIFGANYGWATAAALSWLLMLSTFGAGDASDEE